MLDLKLKTQFELSATAKQMNDNLKNTSGSNMNSSSNGQQLGKMNSSSSNNNNNTHNNNNSASNSNDNEYEGNVELPSLESAAHDAAIADGLISKNAAAAAHNASNPSTDMKSKKAGLRRGKWTAEEETYANRLISEFKAGLLPLTDGTTLRTFLSKLLNCDPMRISKKFVGSNCIGKQVFRRRQQDIDKLPPEQIEKGRRELAELERKFLERVAQNTRKSAAMNTPTPTTAIPTAKETKSNFEDHSLVTPWMRNNNEEYRDYMPSADSTVNPSFPMSMGNSNNNGGNSSTNPMYVMPNSGGYNHTAAVAMQSFAEAQLHANSNLLNSNNMMRASYNSQMNGNQSNAMFGNSQNTSANNLGRYGIQQGGGGGGGSDSDYESYMKFAMNHHKQTTKMDNSQVSMNKVNSNGTNSQYPSLESFGPLDGSVTNENNLTQNGEGLVGWPSMTSLIMSNEDNHDDKDKSRADNKRHMMHQDVISNKRQNIPKPPMQPSQNYYDNGDVGYDIDDDNDPSAMQMGNINPNFYPNAMQQRMYFPPNVMNSMGGDDEIKDSGVIQQHKAAIPHNNSVENFWLLVNMGDLPRPDSSVLNETLWDNNPSMNMHKAVQQGGNIMRNGMSVPNMKPNGMPMNMPNMQPYSPHVKGVIRGSNNIPPQHIQHHMQNSNVYSIPYNTTINRSNLGNSTNLHAAASNNGIAVPLQHLNSMNPSQQQPPQNRNNNRNVPQQPQPTGQQQQQQMNVNMMNSLQAYNNYISAYNSGLDPKNGKVDSSKSKE